VISFFVKQVKEEQATVDFQPQSLHVSFPLPSDVSTLFTMDWDPLFDSIVPADCSTSFHKTKVEVKLKKASIGRSWKSLEGSMESTTGRRMKTSHAYGDRFTNTSLSI